jgi:hypothetical protein
MLEVGSTPGHGAVRRVTSKKNYNNTIKKGTRDLPERSAVPDITLGLRK